jgi:hypothetical protein
MRRAVSVILIYLLAAPPASAAQSMGKPIEWQQVQTLKPGTEIVVRLARGGYRKVRLLFADDKVLITMKLDAPRLSGRVEKLLYGVGAGWPGVVEGAGSYEDHRLRVSRDGIFDGDKKLADLADVIQRSPRADVREITAPPRNTSRNVRIGVAVAVGVGALVAAWLCIMHSSCG